MKTLLTTFILCIALLTTAFAATPAAVTLTTDSTTYKLTVTIAGINQRAGKFHVGLAANGASFTGESIQKQTVTVPATGDVTISFDGLKPGRYAVRIFQDLNDNQKLDFSGQMPGEPIGFSNVTMLMGPPSFDQCSFELNANKTIQVSLLEF